MGGVKLVESAKIMAVSNEVNEYEKAYFTFIHIKGRPPGDLNRSKKIGFYSGQTYDENSFPAPYNSNDKNGIPNTISAPFVDLYLSGLLEF